MRVAPAASSSPPRDTINDARDLRAADAGWVMQWTALTVTASALATTLDAILLQYRRSYFTGGFLASDYLTGPVEALAFLIGSLLTDMAAIGLIAWAALWLSGRLAIRRYLAWAGALVAVLLPVLIADFVEYQLLTYLGDAFDFRLLFELTGRNPGEIAAVSSAHVVRLIGLVAGLGIPAGVAVWLTLRRVTVRTTPSLKVPAGRSLLVAVAVFVAGTGAMTLLRNGSDVLDNGLRRKPTGRALGLVVEAATDFDRDSYGILGRPDDPRLFDRAVRPYALDLPGNGLDEDGVGGDLPAALGPYREDSLDFRPWHSTRDVVLIVLESFRADVRGARLDGKPVTPVLDALANRGIAPDRAYSHNGYTVQSRRHIFTGSTADIRGRDTLIDDFRRHGYEVAYFSGQDESFGGTEHGVGFERADVAYDARADRDRRYSEFSTAGSLAVPYRVVAERIASFLRQRHTKRPLFLYVNFHDTHFPYHHRGIRPLVSTTLVDQARIAADRAADVRAMYMNTASNVDQAIGDVIDDVRTVLGREPAVVVLSDHGESLFDEGFLGHGYALNDAQTRIPLIVANLPVIIDEPFVQADLRDAIGRALERPDSADARPTVTVNSSRTVFQYLGQIEHPAQIALTSMARRVIYDFREQRTRFDNDQWERPEDLDAEKYAMYLRAVHTWERMMLARDAATTAGKVPQ